MLATQLSKERLKNGSGKGHGLHAAREGKADVACAFGSDDLCDKWQLTRDRPTRTHLKRRRTNGKRLENEWKTIGERLNRMETSLHGRWLRFERKTLQRDSRLDGRRRGMQLTFV